MTSANRNIFRVTGHLCGEFMSASNEYIDFQIYFE